MSEEIHKIKDDLSRRPVYVNVKSVMLWAALASVDFGLIVINAAHQNPAWSEITWTAWLLCMFMVWLNVS